MSAALFSTSAVVARRAATKLSDYSTKQQFAKIRDYLSNTNYTFQPWDWDNISDSKWDRVHGDRKSGTKGEVTTWLMHGSDNMYHWNLIFGDGYRADQSFVRGSFDVPPTPEEVMADIKAKVKETYGEEP